jgi:hypothetical protein
MYIQHHECHINRVTSRKLSTQAKDLRLRGN